VVRLAPADVPGPVPRLTAWCDLDVDGKPSVVVALSSDGYARFALDGTLADLDLWLPSAPALRVVSLAVDAGALIEPATPQTGLRWAVYGSSITHGAGLPPTRTWPAVVTRALRRRTHNLGFDGNAHLDPLAAAALAELPVDLLTLELGVNVHLSGSMLERTFAPSVHGFLDRVRVAHPTSPIVVVSPLLCPARENVVPEHGMTLAQIRAILAEAVRLRADDALHHVDGRELLDDLGLLPDGLHPSAAGHREIARRYAELESLLTADRFRFDRSLATSGPVATAAATSTAASPSQPIVPPASTPAVSSAGPIISCTATPSENSDR
ncbi:MAG: GDSL-type esterase/lipase family protein, partial [Actinomycetes bacterium]